MNLFERALRKKIRFNFRGNLTTEDLFDLTQEQLDVL